MPARSEQAKESAAMNAAAKSFEVFVIVYTNIAKETGDEPIGAGLAEGGQSSAAIVCEEG